MAENFCLDLNDGRWPEIVKCASDESLTLNGMVIALAAGGVLGRLRREYTPARHRYLSLGDDRVIIGDATPPPLRPIDCLAAFLAGRKAPPGCLDLSPLRLSEADAALLMLGSDVHHRPGFLPADVADKMFGELLGSIDWQQRQVNVFGWKNENRLTAFYGDEGTKYKYSGRDNATHPWDDDKTGTLLVLRDYLELVTGERYNLCLLNLYEDKNRNIGKHSDDERDLVPGSKIASISLGAPRKFHMERIGGASTAIPVTGVVIGVTHGCLLTMGGTTQRLFKHWVPPGKVDGTRINLTFRRVRAR